MLTFFESEKRGLLFLSLLWILAVIFVNPIGEFPLNDDGLYSRWLRDVMTQTDSGLVSAIGPNLILQATWGALFCEISGGFSFTALRFSTLFLAWATIFPVYGIANYLLQNNPLSALITVIFVFNPVFFSLSFTFMTDVPFLFFLVVSVYFYCRFFENAKNYWRFLAFLFAIFAYLIRQPGILVIFAFETGWIIFNSKDKSHWIAYFFYFLLTVFTYLGIEFYLKDWLNIKEVFSSPVTGFFQSLIHDTDIFIFQIVKRSLMTVFYIGLFFIPFIFPFLRKIRNLNWLRIKFLLPLFLFNIAIIIVLYQIAYIFPYGGNILYNYGLGPVLLKDVYNLKVTILPQIPMFIMMSFGLICQVYGCYLVWYCFFRLFVKRETSRPFSIYFSLILFNIIYLGALFRYNFFDRYLLITFFTVSLLLLSELKVNRKVDKIFIPLTLVASTIFAILGTKDYMNWNRAAAIAWTNLEKKGISFEDIDGGIPFNQFYKENPYDANEEYLITMSNLEGYRKQDSFNFYRNLFFCEDKIYILKKITPDESNN